MLQQLDSIQQPIVQQDLVDVLKIISKLENLEIKKKCF